MQCIEAITRFAKQTPNEMLVKVGLLPWIAETLRTCVTPTQFFKCVTVTKVIAGKITSDAKNETGKKMPYSGEMWKIGDIAMRGFLHYSGVFSLSQFTELCNTILTLLCDSRTHNYQGYSRIWNLQLVSKFLSRINSTTASRTTEKEVVGIIEVLAIIARDCSNSNKNNKNNNKSQRDHVQGALSLKCPVPRCISQFKDEVFLELAKQGLTFFNALNGWADNLWKICCRLCYDFFNCLDEITNSKIDIHIIQLLMQCYYKFGSLGNAYSTQSISTNLRLLNKAISRLLRAYNVKVEISGKDEVSVAIEMHSILIHSYMRASVSVETKESVNKALFASLKQSIKAIAR